MHPVNLADILAVSLLVTACATYSLPLAIAPGTDPGAAEHNGEGIARYNLGDWEGAKTHFEAAVTAAPQSAEAHFNLALALHQLDRHMEAGRHLKQAAALAPDNTAITDSRAYRTHVRARASRGVGGEEGFGGSGYGVLVPLGVY